jgi:hypothetical protein
MKDILAKQSLFKKNLGSPWKKLAIIGLALAYPEILFTVDDFKLVFWDNINLES